MVFPLVRELAATGARVRVPVAATCRVLGFSRQAYYSWPADPVCERDLVNAHATNAAIDAHRDDPEFRYRFIADELAEADHRLSDRRVWRLCSTAGVSSVRSVKRSNGRRPGPPVHDDLVERDFTATAPNQWWLTGITEHATNEETVCCCAVKDVFSNRIVRHSNADRMESQLAVDALDSAMDRRGGRAEVARCVVHSDRGSQGGFNWSSQHVSVRAIVGARSMPRRGCASRVSFAGEC